MDQDESESGVAPTQTDADSVTDQEEETVAPHNLIPTMFGPYVPGISERLRSLSAQNGVRNWYSYSGKLRERFASFKDHLHVSKSQNTVYSVVCKCGVRYIGEMARNLKVRIHEHMLHSANSAIGLNVRAEKDVDAAGRPFCAGRLHCCYRAGEEHQEAKIHQVGLHHVQSTMSVQPWSLHGSVRHVGSKFVSCRSSASEHGLTDCLCALHNWIDSRSMHCGCVHIWLLD